MSYDETRFATFRAATPETAAVLQGFDAVEAFQSAHVFQGTGLEGAAYATHWPTSSSGFPQAHPRAGRDYLDRPRVVFDSIHGFERSD